MSRIAQEEAWEMPALKGDLADICISMIHLIENITDLRTADELHNTEAAVEAVARLEGIKRRIYGRYWRLSGMQDPDVG